MNQKIKKIVLFLFIITLSVSLYSGEKEHNKQIDNVIVFISDGTCVSTYGLTRWYKGSALSMDDLACGLVKTYCSDSAITDSAPGGTALSTGYKTHTGFIAVLPDVANMPGLTPIPEGDKRKPIATILEALKLKGKSTGLIATSNIQHATPATFSSHYPNRNEFEILAEQQVYNNIDVILGGGYQYLMGEKRKDKEDLISVIKNKGYTYITTRDEMLNTKADKLWGMFAPDAMAYDFDRDKTVEPSLSEMTKKAIDILSENKDGFFLMVEASKVDWSAHSNDPVGIISDILALDEAVKVALDFAKKDKNTLIVVVEDHGCGGISIGSKETDKIYDNTHINKYLEPLKKAKLTGEGLEKLINPDKSNAVEIVIEYFGITDLTPEEITAINGFQKGKLNAIVGPMISKRSYIGWTTTGHTGEDVVLYSYSPNHKKLSGVIENTYIPKFIADVTGADLEETTEELFNKIVINTDDPKTLFETTYNKYITSLSSVEITPFNPALVIVLKNGNSVIFPANKNYAVNQDNKILKKFDGVNVFNGINWFISDEGIDLIK